ncbi:MAG: hypothetical protein ACYSW3_30415 [Planctomycetota bacterium]
MKHVLMVMAAVFVLCGWIELAVAADDGAALKDWGPAMDHSIVVLGSQIPLEDVDKRSYISYVFWSVSLMSARAIARKNPNRWTRGGGCKGLIVAILPARTC